MSYPACPERRHSPGRLTSPCQARPTEPNTARLSLPPPPLGPPQLPRYTSSLTPRTLRVIWLRLTTTPLSVRRRPPSSPRAAAVRCRPRASQYCSALRLAVPIHRARSGHYRPLPATGRRRWPPLTADRAPISPAGALPSHRPTDLPSHRPTALPSHRPTALSSHRPTALPSHRLADLPTHEQRRRRRRRTRRGRVHFVPLVTLRLGKRRRGKVGGVLCSRVPRKFVRGKRH